MLLLEQHPQLQASVGFHHGMTIVRTMHAGGRSGCYIVVDVISSTWFVAAAQGPGTWSHMLSVQSQPAVVVHCGQYCCSWGSAALIVGCLAARGCGSSVRHGSRRVHACIQACVWAAAN
jgi:hypothetical protein